MLNKIVVLLLILFLASCGNEKTANVSSDSSKEISGASSAVQSIVADLKEGSYVKGELLVKFKSGVAAVSSAGVHRAMGATSLKKFSIVPNLEHVKLPEGLSVKDAIVKYTSDPTVEYAEPNYLKRVVRTPSDTFFNQQWALRNTGQTVNGITGKVGADINATQAWDIATGSNSVIIAVLDTGVASTHEDLAANVISGINFTVTPNTTDTTDDFGHGTHVSGTIGAVGDNSKGIAGVMWGVKIMPLKICDSTGTCPEDAEISAIGYAVAHGAKIMNASFASSFPDPAESEAISEANAAGVLLMAAAGNGSGDFCDSGVGNNNDGTTKCYPASYNLPNIISIAATNQTDNKASFSNFGAASVHVAAPGVNILSTIPLNLPPCKDPADKSYVPFASNYDFCSGTSMATPHVSGLAGLLYSAYPSFTYSQIRGMIMKYVDVLPSLQGVIFSNGRISAYRSVSALLTPTNLAASFLPGRVSLTWADNATGEEGYKIERKAGGGSFAQIGSTGPNASTFTDNTPIEATTVTYRVRAFNASLPNPPSTSFIEADSSYSNEAAVATPLNPPTNLIVNTNTITSTSLTFTWSDNSQSEDGYKIERKSPGGDFIQIATVGPNVTTYTDSGLSPGTTYIYRVRAFSSAAGNSQYSNEISPATPPAAPLPLNGVCGSSNGQTLPTAPADNLCSVGTPSAVSGSGPWIWTCSGSNGGTTANCSANSSTPAPQPSGGGGGCSIGVVPNSTTAVADSVVLLVPVAVVALLRRRR